MSNECVKCRAPAGGVALCSTCTLALRVELGDVPELLIDLEITRSRQDRLTPPYDHGPASAETPLPYKPHVDEVVWILTNTLSQWVETLLPSGNRKPDTPHGCARWLMRNVDLVRRYAGAAQLVDEVTNAVRHARYATDRREDRRLFVGPCNVGDCTAEVWGQPGQRTTACPACGAEHDIAARQEWLHTIARSYLATPPEISGFLKLTGVSCSAAAIRNYAARGRLAAGGVNSKGHSLYKIEDVLTAIETRYRHQKKAS